MYISTSSTALGERSFGTGLYSRTGGRLGWFCIVLVPSWPGGRKKVQWMGTIVHYVQDNSWVLLLYIIVGGCIVHYV
jgi:hypothetical protein